MVKVKLSREVGLSFLVLYGLGNILGAGIYVLVGKVAGVSGYFSLLSFILACTVAFFTALSYMELASRYPFSAGAAIYIHEGFGSQTLSLIVGILIAAAALVSSATLAHGFVGYLLQFFEINEYLVLVMLISILVLIAIKGIKASVMVAALLTLVEVFGLLWMIYHGFDGIVNVKIEWDAFIPSPSFNDISMVFLGTFLAFYAFIGFEDIVNIAEEVKDPRRNYPIAITLALGISTVLYILILMVAFDVLSIEELKNSRAPFADMYQQFTDNDPVLISLIGMFAVLNGALIQIIMASRVVYGMAARSWLPSTFADVSPRTKTPVKATLTVGLIALLFSMFFDIVFLAGFTSVLILIVFTLVNVALIRIKKKEPVIEGVICIPLWVPWVATFLNVALVVMSFLAL